MVYAVSDTGLLPPMAGLSSPLLLQLRRRRASATALGSPSTPYAQRLQPSTCIRFGLFPLRSPLLGESRLLSLPRGTKMFQFPRFAPCTYGFSTECLDITPGGLPHSGIPGSMPACGSPGLFAAYHALLRLLAPRHPPLGTCT